jgi:circadian clock protein KaiC
MKVSTGLKGLDSLLGGGLPKNTVTLISGGPGTGKTLISLNFLLDGARKKERCCYVSLSESKEELIRACQEIESLKEIEKYIGKNLALEYIQLGENITLKRFIEIISSYPKIDRLVIDNVNKLLIFAESPRAYRLSLSELVKHLKNIGCSLILCETKEDEFDSGNNEAFECDGVIQLSFLELEEKPMRTITLHKLRYSSFEPKVPREFIINKKELRLGSVKII